MVNKNVQIILHGQFKNKEAIIAGLSEVNKKLDASAKTAEKSSKKFLKFTKILKTTAAALGIAFSIRTVIKFGKAIIKSTGEMEQFTVAFTAMLESSENAKVLMEDAIAFARRSPFSITGILTTTKQLLAYGLVQEEIIPTLQLLGDISAGTGSDISLLSKAFIDVKAKGKLAGQEVIQFANAGVNIREILSKNLGITIAKVEELQRKGKISFGDVKNAIISAYGSGSKFSGLMEKQSRTIPGMIERMRESWTLLGIEIGSASSKIIRFAIETSSNIANNLTLSLQSVRKYHKESLILWNDLFSSIVSGFDKMIGTNMGQRLKEKENLEEILSLEKEARLKSLEEETSGLEQKLNDEKENLTSHQEELLKLEEVFLAGKKDLKEYEKEEDEIRREEELAKINEWYQSQVTGQKLTDDEKIELRKKYDKKVAKLDDKKGKLEKFLENEHIKNSKKAADQLVELQNSKHKSIATIGKAAAIYQSTIDTATGAISAYKSLAGIPIVGPALGAAAAAAIVAYGAEKIGAITSTSFEVGASKIPNDQLANIHQGEMIIPKSFSNAIRSGELSLSGGAESNINNNSDSTTIINFDGANFIGIDDDVAEQISVKISQLIEDNKITPIPTRSKTL